MEQSDTIYNNTYDAPKLEFVDENKNKKCCYKCKHYGCLANQGYWWCNLQLDMDNEDCPSCDTTIQDSAVMTYYTYESKPDKSQSMTPKQYGEHLMRTGKNKKK